MKKENFAKTLAFVAVIFIMLSAYILNRHKAKIIEASKLPFYQVNLEQVEDGVYPGKTYTSFAHVQLEVTVKNHTITDISASECDGLEVVKAKNVLQRMIEQNKIIVPAQKGEEIGTMVLISCVDGALHGQDDVITSGENFGE